MWATISISILAILIENSIFMGMKSFLISLPFLAFLFGVKYLYKWILIFVIYFLVSANTHMYLFNAFILALYYLSIHYLHINTDSGLSRIYMFTFAQLLFYVILLHFKFKISYLLVHLAVFFILNIIYTKLSDEGN